MSPKKIIWLTVAGTSMYVGYQWVRHRDFDPTPQLIGIAGTGVILLGTSEIAPEFAGALAGLIAIGFLYAWPFTEKVGN